MKQLRVVFASVAIAAAGAWAIVAVACDQKSATAANPGACPSMTAAECRAKMAAGQTCPMHGTHAATVSMTDPGAATTATNGDCGARVMNTAAGRCPYAGATTAAMGGCSAHGAATTTAATGGCSAHGATTATAATAAAGGCPAHGAAAGGAGTCPAHTSGVTAAMGSCAGHGVSAMTAVDRHPASFATAAATHAGCAASKSRVAYARGLCPEHNVSVLAAGLGSNCSGHVGATAHGSCDACDDLAACDAELQAAGVTMQTVPIKNGVMFVYTAKTPGGVNAIQSVMARRTEHLARIVSSGSTARLCDDCKSMRGEMASGRLVREVVNIESGTLVLVSSDDPALVRHIRELADASRMAVKS